MVKVRDMKLNWPKIEAYEHVFRLLSLNASMTGGSNMSMPCLTFPRGGFRPIFQKGRMATPWGL